MIPLSQAWFPNRPYIGFLNVGSQPHLPSPWGLPWNTQLPHPGQERRLFPWGLLGIAGSWEPFPAAAGDREPRNACASLAFLGPTVLPLKSLGPTRPHSGPHGWYILSNYERNLERDDSSVGQCRTGSCLSCQFPHLPLLGLHSTPFCSELSKFQQNLGCSTGACSGSHLCPILVHLARPGHALLPPEPSRECTPAAGAQLQ